MTQAFQKKYLIFTSFLIGSFGPIFFLGSMFETSALASWSLDLLSWPIDGNMNYSAPTTRFLSALTGGFLFGWGMTVFCLSLWVFDSAPNECRKVVLVGIMSWFCLDSLGSVLSGNVSNMFFNVIIACLAIGPLVRKAKALD